MVCPCEVVMDNENALHKISQLARWSDSSCAAMVGQCNSKDILRGDEVGAYVVISSIIIIVVMP